MLQYIGLILINKRQELKNIVFFRELPDPLFCTEYAEEWRRVNQVQDELERIREIKLLLGKLPKPNRDNIEYLFQFLEKIVAEEFYNKMSVENLLVVFSPNLLWNASGHHIPIDAVQKSMIVRHSWIFDSNDNISNLLTLRYQISAEPDDVDEVAFNNGTNVINSLQCYSLITFFSFIDPDIRQGGNQDMTTLTIIQQ